MTREEAEISMKQGKKVTHKKLEYNSYITMNKCGKIVFENGVTLSKHIFWFSRMDDVFNDGWTIIE